MKSLVAVLICMSFLFSACQEVGKAQSTNTEVPPTTESVTTVNEVLSAAEFSKKLAAHPGAQLIDVRTPNEHNAGHIEGSKNINIFDADFEAQIQNTCEKEMPVFLYCKAGSRSAKAASKLAELGYQEIYDLEGGYTKWSQQ